MHYLVRLFCLVVWLSSHDFYIISFHVDCFHIRLTLSLIASYHGYLCSMITFLFIKNLTERCAFIGRFESEYCLLFATLIEYALFGEIIAYNYAIIFPCFSCYNLPCWLFSYATCPVFDDLTKFLLLTRCDKMKESRCIMSSGQQSLLRMFKGYYPILFNVTVLSFWYFL